MLRERHFERLRRLSAAVVRSRQAHSDTVATRDGAIREADADGWTLGQIADATSLARQTIHEIVSKGGPSS